MLKFPGVTAPALLALALGTGVNTTLFSIVNAVLLEPLPFPQSDELVQVWRTELPRLQYGSASYPRYVDWRARNRAYGGRHLSRWRPDNAGRPARALRGEHA